MVEPEMDGVAESEAALKFWKEDGRATLSKLLEQRTRTWLSGTADCPRKRATSYKSGANWLHGLEGLQTVSDNGLHRISAVAK